MLGKLIKHEFIATRRTIPLIAVVAAFFIGLYLLGQQLELDWLFSSSMVLAILALVALSVVTTLVLIFRLFKSQYGDEGYLTHTLPVTPGQILFSKLLVCAFWIFIALAASLGSAFLLLWPYIRTGGVLYPVWEAFKAVLAMYPTWQLILIVAYYLIIAALGFFAQITFAITLGNTASFHKHTIAFSVGIYLAVNLVLGQVSGLIMMFVPPSLHFTADGIEIYAGNMMKWALDLENTANFTGFAIGIVGMIIEPLISATLLFLSYKIMTKKLSIR